MKVSVIIISAFLAVLGASTVGTHSSSKVPTKEHELVEKIIAAESKIKATHEPAEQERLRHELSALVADLGKAVRDQPAPPPPPRGAVRPQPRKAGSQLHKRLDEPAHPQPKGATSPQSHKARFSRQERVKESAHHLSGAKEALEHYDTRCKQHLATLLALDSSRHFNQDKAVRSRAKAQLATLLKSSAEERARLLAHVVVDDALRAERRQALKKFLHDEYLPKVTKLLQAAPKIQNDDQLRAFFHELGHTILEARLRRGMTKALLNKPTRP